VLTGHGLKDPDSGARLVAPPLEAEATLGAIMDALGWR
jgi:hypothetical protein